MLTVERGERKRTVDEVSKAVRRCQNRGLTLPLGSARGNPAAARRHTAGTLSREALWDIERQSIARAVELQKEAGLRVCTDGEYHRRHWFIDFVERIDGVAFEGGLKTTFRTDLFIGKMATPSLCPFD